MGTWGHSVYSQTWGFRHDETHSYHSYFEHQHIEILWNNFDQPNMQVLIINCAFHEELATMRTLRLKHLKSIDAVAKSSYVSSRCISSLINWILEFWSIVGVLTVSSNVYIICCLVRYWEWVETISYRIMFDWWLRWGNEIYSFVERYY